MAIRGTALALASFFSPGGFCLVETQRKIDKKPLKDAVMAY